MVKHYMTILNLNECYISILKIDKWLIMLIMISILIIHFKNQTTTSSTWY